jgi:hypothetical protein
MGPAPVFRPICSGPPVACFRAYFEPAYEVVLELEFRLRKRDLSRLSLGDAVSSNTPGGAG